MAGFEIVGGLVVGLVLFLYGVTRLSEALRAAFGDRLRDGLARFTRNRFAGVGTGAVATALVDSSSVTIATVIALVHAGVLPFAHSLGVILGANIGTTLSSQLFALRGAAFAPIVLALGFALHAFGRSERARHGGGALLGLGMIFFGLEEMGRAVEPLRDHAAFAAWMTKLENPFVGLLAGLVATAVLQSSSATLGLAITLAGEGMMTLPAGVAVMLGAEIGTCADTLLAALGRSRAALRAGLFHLGFNVAAALVGLAFATRIADAAAWMAGGAGDVPRQIANAHLLFNVAGVVLVVGFLPRIARWMIRVVPDVARPPAAAPALSAPVMDA
ncbi:MAG TPA: Na/Pi symporter [Longimicrobium sp.]|nr:Na/Pi symporter [Longimicrobium sp.]